MIKKPIQAVIKFHKAFGLSIENKPNIKIIFLHAKEIIQRIADGTIDLGISGLDLLRESGKNLQNKIVVYKQLDFGKANLVVAVPDDWIDVQTVADLEEVSFCQIDQ